MPLSALRPSAACLSSPREDSGRRSAGGVGTADSPPHGCTRNRFHRLPLLSSLCFCFPQAVTVALVQKTSQAATRATSFGFVSCSQGQP